VTRLHDMGVEPFKLAASLVGVIAQRLVRTVCQACKTVYYPSDDVFELLHYQGDRRRQFVQGKGCRACYDTGLRGRVGIYEVLQVSREIRSAISRGGDIEEIRSLHLSQGGSLLLDEGIGLAETGRTSLDEVLRVAYAE